MATFVYDYLIAKYKWMVIYDLNISGNKVSPLNRIKTQRNIKKKIHYHNTLKELLYVSTKISHIQRSRRPKILLLSINKNQNVNEPKSHLYPFVSFLHFFPNLHICLTESRKWKNIFCYLFLFNISNLMIKDIRYSRRWLSMNLTIAFHYKSTMPWVTAFLTEWPDNWEWPTLS